MIRHAIAGTMLMAAAAGSPATGREAPDGLAQQRLAERPDRAFALAEEEAARKDRLFRRALGDEYRDFEVDLEAGTISFTGDSRMLSAPIQVVGTYNTRDGTFLWGWDHPSVPDALAADARRVRAFGRRHDLSLLTTRKVECTEDEAWGFTALALYLSDAEGVYRAPYGTALVYLTLGELEAAPLE